MQVEYSAQKMCGLLDSGAQISLMNRSSWNIVSQLDPSLKLLSCNRDIFGIGHGELKILGFAMIKLVWCVETCKPVPFGIVNDEIIVEKVTQKSPF